MNPLSPPRLRLTSLLSSTSCQFKHLIPHCQLIGLLMSCFLFRLQTLLVNPLQSLQIRHRKQPQAARQKRHPRLQRSHRSTYPSMLLETIFTRRKQYTTDNHINIHLTFRIIHRILQFRARCHTIIRNFKYLSIFQFFIVVKCTSFRYMNFFISNQCTISQPSNLICFDEQLVH